MSMKTTHRRPVPLSALLCGLAAFLILCGLGTWQVQRMGWKAEILHALDEADRAAPVRLTMADLESAAARKDFALRGSVTGHFIPSAEMLVGPRTRDGVAGFHLYAPFTLDTGGTVLINRGFMPGSDREQALALYRAEKLPHRVTGLARRPERPNMFVPANKPDRNIWYAIDLTEAARRAGTETVAPYVLYEEESDASNSVAIPHPQGWRPRNNHLQYAAFWYSMAGVLAMIFWLRFLKAPRRDA